MALQRKQYWDTRDYHQFIVASRTEPFVWGTHDCCTFVAKAIEAQTGVRIDDDFAGKYNDKASAFKLIKKITDGTTVADAAAYCAAKHGLPELQYPLLAQRGDLVIVKNPDGEEIAAVVHLNGRHAVTVGENGIVTFPVSSVIRAWSVTGKHAHPKAFKHE